MLLSREILAQLLQTAEALAQEKGRHASCSVNMPQAVIQFDFTAAGPELYAVSRPDESESE